MDGVSPQPLFRLSGTADSQGRIWVVAWVWEAAVAPLKVPFPKSQEEPDAVMAVQVSTVVLDVTVPELAL